MARTSRKITVGAISPKSIERIFKTAVYARLSNEDSGRADGQTLENQILLVKKYIEAKPYLKLCQTFVDNGQTGTNFDRDGFCELMAAVKRGKVDCIVVKDLSRFGRDYIETGDYIEKILPFLGVRFISVNDGYDSHDSAKSGDVLAIALKNLINDIYAKDISRKIKSAFEIKRKKGEFTGGFASYGYFKSPEDKHRLIINEETAPIVRDIFGMKLDGMSNTAIARNLNDRGILSPSNYLHSKGIVINERYSKKILWSRDYIKKILLNPVYIGHTAQGKTTSDLNLGFDRKAQAKDSWIIVENTHEPIIELSVFEAVGNIVEKRKKEYNEKQSSKRWQVPENIFSSLLCCSGCGTNLVRTKSTSQNKKIYMRFVCPNYVVHFTDCCKKKSISEINLREAVSAIVHQQIMLMGGVEKKANREYELRGVEQEKQSLEQRLYSLNSLRSSLYDNFIDNLLMEHEYNHLRREYEMENEELALRLNEVAAEVEQYSEDFANGSNDALQMRQFNAADNLSREMLAALVEKIIIYSGNAIEIKFKYKDEFANNTRKA